MPKVHVRPPLLAAFLLLAGCAQQTEVDANKSRLDALEARLVALEAAGTTKDERRLIEEEDLDIPLRSLIRRVEISGYGELTVGAEGYQMILTRHGPVAVTFKGIEALGAGAKVTISFVNLSSVGWTDISLNGQYKNFVSGNGAIIENPKLLSFDKRVTGTWEPGKQAIVSINLPEMSDKEVKSLDLHIEPDGIAYRR